MVDERKKAALKNAAGVSGGKDECQERLKSTERDYWMGTEIGMLGGCGFQGQLMTGDESDQKGKMGAGYIFEQPLSKTLDLLRVVTGLAENEPA